MLLLQWTFTWISHQTWIVSLDQAAKQRLPLITLIKVGHVKGITNSGNNIIHVQAVAVLFYVVTCCCGTSFTSFIFVGFFFLAYTDTHTHCFHRSPTHWATWNKRNSERVKNDRQECPPEPPGGSPQKTLPPVSRVNLTADAALLLFTWRSDRIHNFTEHMPHKRQVCVLDFVTTLRPCWY